MKIALSLLLITFAACDAGKKVDKDQVDQMKRSMEVKKVSEVEIISKALEWGDELSQEAQAALMEALQKAIANKGAVGAVEFCKVEALPLTQGVAEKHGVTINRVSEKNRNPKNSPQEVEKPLLDAYAYNTEEGIKNASNVQKMVDNETLMFTKAIVIPGELCLNCHGTPGQEVADDTYEKIKALYPDDKAIGYKVGDLRGMWSVYIPKKEVIKRM